MRGGNKANGRELQYPRPDSMQGGTKHNGNAAASIWKLLLQPRRGPRSLVLLGNPIVSDQQMLHRVKTPIATSTSGQAQSTTNMAGTAVHCAGALFLPAAPIGKARLLASRQLSLTRARVSFSCGDLRKVKLWSSGSNTVEPTSITSSGNPSSVLFKRRSHCKSVQCQVAGEKSSEGQRTVTLDPAPEVELSSSPLDLERLFRGADPRVLPPQEDSRLAAIKESRFDRGGLNGAGIVGLRPFFEGKVPEAFKEVYSEEELAALAALQGSAQDVEKRMKVGIALLTDGRVRKYPFFLYFL